MHARRIVLSLLFAFCGASTAAAATYHVCPAGCPFSSIQMAMDLAADGDTVILHDGFYPQRIDFKGKAITVRSVNGPEATVLDAGEAGSVVLMTSGEGRDSVLEGLTLTNGHSTFGGGILISDSSPTIRNCVVVSNAALSVGGGIYLSQASPLIEDCAIEGNQSSAHGGGIGMSYSLSQPVIRNTSITGNAAASYGGGVYCSESSQPVIIDSRVNRNEAAYGGGLGAIESSQPDVTRTLFEMNVVGSSGGGIWLAGAALNLRHSWVRRNMSSGVGGGISIEERVAASSAAALDDSDVSNNLTYTGGGIYVSNSSVTVRRSFLRGNMAVDYGGGIYTVGSSSAVTDSILSGNWSNYGGGVYVTNDAVTLTHCTLAGNYASSRGGAVTSGPAASLSIRNSILWGDGAGTANPEVYTTGLVSVNYSDVQGGITGWGTGTGNIDYDPYFVSPRPAGRDAGGDYRLQWISLCVDAGSASYATPLDIHGDPRYQAPGPDMGADESALLVNGSFDAFEERRPVPWKALNLVAKDRRVTGEARSGDSSFRITGGPGVKKLRQVKTLTGPTGFPITVGAWSKASGTTPAGGFYGLKVKVFYQDDTSKVYKVAFDKSDHDWQYREIGFDAAYYYEKFVVDLVYADQAGRAWFDDVYLHAPAY